MKPAINRMKQGVFTENQYIDFLEEKYSKVYVATIKACEFLKEELHIKKLPEGEMGFIALYFCVAVEQQKDKEEKLSVYVACPHGVGTSHMLAVHLKKEFPQIRQKLWKECFWSQSFCLLTTGGAPIEVIRKYIESQGEKSRKRGRSYGKQSI